MTVYRLAPRSLPAGGLALRLGWGWRAFFVLLTMIFLGVILYDGEVRGVVGFLALLSFGAALYQEFWSFLPSSDEIVAGVGVFFLCRVRRYRLSRVERVLVRLRAPFDPDAAAAPGELIGSRRAGSAPFQRGYAQLFLELAPDPSGPDSGDAASRETLLLQTEPLRNRESLKELARTLAQALGVPVEHRFG
ncbi:hypothetical protein SAMN05920897_1057 [Alkalispirochaeta americana]|uniref:Uncharacterized protein n=1 Tax=Alkalispirochaeta americana TaxID=159291 RepID=A0A1N6QQ20_9SPIO|nr:hypothetical protein [Alkalispirochaeta americana]SIQ18697.1 hypothetical protein SAMN05920897_1057 [Alkalispirochaeta americana]